MNITFSQASCQVLVLNKGHVALTFAPFGFPLEDLAKLVQNFMISSDSFASYTWHKLCFFVGGGREVEESYPCGEVETRVPGGIKDQR